MEAGLTLGDIQLRHAPVHFLTVLPRKIVMPINERHFLMQLPCSILFMTLRRLLSRSPTSQRRRETGASPFLDPLVGEGQLVRGREINGLTGAVDDPCARGNVGRPRLGPARGSYCHDESVSHDDSPVFDDLPGSGDDTSPGNHEPIGPLRPFRCERRSDENDEDEARRYRAYPSFPCVHV